MNTENKILLLFLTVGVRKKNRNRKTEPKNYTEKPVNQVGFLRIFGSVNQTGNFFGLRFGFGS